MMPAVAYFFIDGPWRCCWVRYGYDPRNNSDSKIYQVVEMRATRIQSMIDMFPLALRKAADSVPEKHVFDGLHIISNMSQFQYCDLTFPLIQNIINNRENLRDSCDVQSQL
jgi:general transcription factor 3C polypeptide 5 (transcription factor C subunit 1)